MIRALNPLNRDRSAERELGANPLRFNEPSRSSALRFLGREFPELIRALRP